MTRWGSRCNKKGLPRFREPRGSRYRRSGTSGCPPLSRDGLPGNSDEYFSDTQSGELVLILIDLVYRAVATTFLFIVALTGMGPLPRPRSTGQARQGVDHEHALENRADWNHRIAGRLRPQRAGPRAGRCRCGAATGATVGLVGGPVGVVAGAVIGGGAGAIAGASTRAADVNLGKPLWERK